MAALEQRGLSVPRAVDHNRHAVLMSLIDAYPLTQVPHLCPPACLIPPASEPAIAIAHGRYRRYYVPGARPLTIQVSTCRISWRDVCMWVVITPGCR